jgi:D-alanyl-D-alanine carboxypeptidase/D-alanyl-D-alanine-endopeptidase (penicillin-binding protein 4)
MISKHYYLIIFLLVALQAFTSNVSGSNWKDVPKQITELVESSFGENAIAAIDLRYVSSGETICSVNNRLTMVPASIQKCVTAICALQSMGPEKRFETTLYSSEKPKSGILNGDIIIVGGGDPSLGCDYFTDDCKRESIIPKWNEVIKNSGIREIKGNIVGDGSLFTDQPLSRYAILEDIGNYYGSVTSGLSFNGNQYYLYLSSSDMPGYPVKTLYTDPEFTSITFWDNQLQSGQKGSGDNAYIFGTPWSSTRLITGTIPPGKKSFKIKGSLPNPAYTCAALLKKNLTENGIKVSGNAIGRTSGLSSKYTVKLHNHNSPPLGTLITRLNKDSDNVFAEQLFLLTAINEQGSATWKNGGIALNKILKKSNINLEGVYLKDGSGLSRYNGLTAKFLGDCLYFASKQNWFNSFLNSLPVSGTDGSLKTSFNDSLLKHRVFAKTGTMERVQALSGYIKCKSGKIVTIVFMVNNGNLSYGATIKVLQRIATLIINL